MLVEQPSTTTRRVPPPPRRRSPAPDRDRYGLHLLLFVLTLVSTALAGAQLVRSVPILTFDLGQLAANVVAFVQTPVLLRDGLLFGGSLLLFLTVHEFGHYFAARSHNVRVSLPYYIPFPFNGIGTFGAVIRIREVVPSLRKLFDIGAAGPLAGFVIALGVLIYALATLPSPEYMLDLPGHDPLKAYIDQYGAFPSQPLPPPAGQEGFTLVIGQTPLYWLLTQFFADVPPMWEMYHYPMLFAGWLGLFFTALNLLPVGQLDGGHILYALVGPTWHRRLARGFVCLLLVSGAIGFAGEAIPDLIAWRPEMAYGGWFVLAAILYWLLNRTFDRDPRLVVPALLALIAVAAIARVIGEPLLQFGYTGWLMWSALIVYLIRIEHPPVLYHEPLTPTRRLLAYVSIVIFFACFSLKPLYVV